MIRQVLIFTGPWLLVANLLCLTGWFRRFAKPYAVLMPAMTAALLLAFPPALALWRGILGDLSIGFQLFLGLFLLARTPGQRIVDRNSHAPLLTAVILASLTLYPFAWGLTLFDPYRLGYGSIEMIAVLLVLAAVAFNVKNYLAAATVLTAVAAFNLNALESTNLWDYLIDPVFVMYACISRGRSFAVGRVFKYGKKAR